MDSIKRDMQRIERLNVTLKSWPPSKSAAGPATNKYNLLIDVIKEGEALGKKRFVELAHKMLQDHLDTYYDVIDDALMDGYAGVVVKTSSAKRKMKDAPLTPSQVNDKQVAKKVDQLISRLREAQHMTTPQVPGSETYPKLQHMLLSYNECAPNGSGGDRASLSPKDKRRPGAPQLIAATTLGDQTMFSKKLWHKGLEAVLWKLKTKGDLETEDRFKGKHGSCVDVSFAFDKEDHLERLFGVDEDSNTKTRTGSKTSIKSSPTLVGPPSINRKRSSFLVSGDASSTITLSPSSQNSSGKRRSTTRSLSPDRAAVKIYFNR